MEFGVALPVDRRQFQRSIVDVIADDSLPKMVFEMLHEMLTRLTRLDDQVTDLDVIIACWVRQDEAASKLVQLEGIGPLTASALVATPGNGSSFKTGRQFAAWLGVVPSQYSSGGKNKLGGIAKKGDRYLRKLLVHGARTVFLTSSKEKGRHRAWIECLRERRPENVVVVAMAAKQARMAWAVMVGERHPCRSTKKQ